MSLYWKNDLLRLSHPETYQSIETWILLNGSPLNIYGITRITYHPQKYISTALAKCLSFLFLRTSTQPITLRSLRSEYLLSSLFDNIKNDNNQTILNEVLPLIFWYNYYGDENNFIDERATFQEKLSSKIEFYDNDKAKLVNDMKSLSSQEKVFLILSGKDCAEILHLVHQFSSLDSIFIYCLNKSKYDCYKPKYFKIVGIINHPLELIHVIEKQRRRLEMQRNQLSLYADQNLKTMHFFSKGTSPAFVWYQAFKNILRANQNNDSRIDAKNEMIKLCRICHSSNYKKQIDYFEKAYSDDRPIKWYTRDIFLYRFVNRVLRTENIPDLLALRFYINDLSKDLEVCQQEQIKNNQIPSRVYRGQRATMNDVERLQGNIACLISSNGYLSTTEELEVAKINAGFYENQVSIIFQIEITKTVHTKNIFANICQYSEFPEEREVLFDIGTVFILQSVQRYQNVTWLARLTISDKEQEQADMYIQCKLREFRHQPYQILAGQMLIEVGQYQQAKKYLTDFQEKLDTQGKFLPALYHLLGMVEFYLNNYQQSSKYFDKAYYGFDSRRSANLITDLCYFYTSENENLLKIFSSTSLAMYYQQYRYIFAVHQQLELDSVLDYVHKAYHQSLNLCFYLLKIYKKKQTNDFVKISRLLERISQIYTKLNRSILASKFNECARNFYQAILPDEHPQFKQSTNSYISSSVSIDEAMDLIIVKYYLPITHKNSKYTVEFESKISSITVLPLETLHDIELKIKQLYPKHDRIDCDIIDEDNTTVRRSICSTLTPIIINIDSGIENKHESFHLVINSHERVETLQDKIEESMKIPFYHQILEYQDQELFSYKFLSDYNIENNSTILLKQRLNRKDVTILINIVSIDQDQFQFERKISSPKQNVFQLKKDLENSLGIPFDDQQLSYNDTILHDHEELLRDCEIQENSTLILTLQQCYLPRKLSIEYSSTYTFEIQFYKTIEELKKVIANELNIQSKYQKLTINDIELENNQFINMINQDSILKLIDRRLIPVQIFIQYDIQSIFIEQKYENENSEDAIDYKNDLKRFLLTKQNISIPLSLKLGDTIEHIKQLIEDKENIAIEHQKLLIKDEQNSLDVVCNSASLIDNGIKDQSSFILRIGDCAAVFIGRGTDQRGPFYIEMIEEESHRVLNIKKKFAQRYNITDIDSQSLFVMSKEKIYEDSPLLDTALVQHNDILILKPRPIPDPTIFQSREVNETGLSPMSQFSAYTIRTMDPNFIETRGSPYYLNSTKNIRCYRTPLGVLSENPRLSFFRKSFCNFFQNPL